MATSSFNDIQAQIRAHEEQLAQLKITAAKLRSEEISAIVEDLQRKITEFGLSASELGLNKRPVSPKRRAAAGPKGPTYRGPNGETWVGGSRGRKPRWLSEGLAAGKTLSDFAA